MSTTQRWEEFFVDQSEMSIVLCQPIRDKPSFVSTNQKQVFTNLENHITEPALFSLEPQLLEDCDTKIRIVSTYQRLVLHSINQSEISIA